MNGMRGRCPLRMALLAMILAGCEQLPTEEEATRYAREAAGEPQEKQFFAFAPDQLAALDLLGLVKFKSDRRHMGAPVFEITLTEEGTSLGLEVDWPTPTWPWGPSGAKARKESLCRIEFDKVTRIVANETGPLKAADVTYVKRTTGHSRLHARPHESRLPLAEFCDPALAESGDLVLVRRDEGWRVNRAPNWKGDWKAATKYEYDEYGRLDGAVTAITLTGALYDSDGDAITEEGWSAKRPFVHESEVGGIPQRTVELVEAPLEVSGQVVTFRPEIHDGQPAGGSLRLAARDPWQSGGLEICLEGVSLGC